MCHLTRQEESYHNVYTNHCSVHLKYLTILSIIRPHSWREKRSETRPDGQNPRCPGHGDGHRGGQMLSSISVELPSRRPL